MMKVKKILSFVLVTVMLLSMFAVPSAAVEGETDTVVVHYYNENGWENPYIYYYSDDSLPITWPGEAMTSEGNGWYSFTITSSSQARVIFSNNGANQYPAQSEQGLLISGEQWFRSGTLFDQNPDLTRITVHYYNSNQWSNPYIYYYTDTELPITWPGVAMISDGNGWYSYDIYGFEDVKVIFSNNGANQSPAQGQAGYTVTSDGWFINDTWYDAEPDGITVHYYNYDDWANVNIYYYNGVIEGTEWVGVPMYADGDGWYTYKIYGYDEARVLFNNGNGIQIPGVMVEGFLVSGEMWYRNGTWTNDRPEEILVYFYKPDNWSAPNIYYYLNDSDTGPAWPGVVMTQVYENWYSFTITKYSSAKVLFNDGTNQIPAQNQSGLDASGIMWYKDGIWCNMTTDTDSDGLLDYLELVFGTNVNNPDTDGDGLPDGYEVNTLGTDPTMADSDDNGVNDGAEDADGDGLTNLEEYLLGTDPLSADTDGDGLSDYDEAHVYFTNPINADTDGDTLSDFDDVALGFSPLLQDTDGNGILDCDEKTEQSISQAINESEKPEVTAVTVAFSGTGNINSTTTIENLYNIDMVSSNVAGLIGVPVEITTVSEFDEAVITFTYDETQLGDTPEENLSIMWYDEEEKWFTILDEDSVIDTENNTVSVVTTHFSKYLLVDREKWHDTWKNQFADYKRNDDIGYHFAFVVDVSGSMYGTRIETAKTALLQFADDLTENDDKFLVTFNGSAQVISDIWNNIDEFKSAVSNLTAGGGTSVSSGLNKAINYITTLESSKESIIILICDGDVDNCSSAVEYCKENNIKIYTVNVEVSDSAQLKSMAEETGGEYYMAENAEDLIDIFNYLNIQISTSEIDFDGLPDVFETNGMYTLNGQIYYSSLLHKDTDHDGVNDNAEMGIPDGADYTDYIFAGRRYIGGEYQYVVYFDAVSDPSNPDSDGDGYTDDIDIRPLSNDIYEVSLKSSYISIEGNDCGGNQGNFPENSIQECGCGLIAATDTLLYLLTKNEKYSCDELEKWGILLSYNEDNRITLDSYKSVVHFLQSDYFQIIYFIGVPGPTIAAGMNTWFGQLDYNLNSYWGCTSTVDVNSITNMLNNDIPVILSICSLGDGVAFYTSIDGVYKKDGEITMTQMCNNHYVTVTGVLFDTYNDEAWLKISSWGREYYINYNEYISGIYLPIANNILKIYEN